MLALMILMMLGRIILNQHQQYDAHKDLEAQAKVNTRGRFKEVVLLMDIRDPVLVENSESQFDVAEMML